MRHSSLSHEKARFQSFKSFKVAQVNPKVSKADQKQMARQAERDLHGPSGLNFETLKP
jgi:hypothetical protein